MSWARLHDGANENQKQLDAGAEACWLWACGLMYANRQVKRNGFIPAAVVGMLYPFKSPQKLAAKLVSVGLWEKAPGGFQIHDYQTWNKTKEQVEHEKSEARRRAAESYDRRKQNSAPPSALSSAPAEVPPQKSDSAGVVVVLASDPSGDPRATTDQDTARDLVAEARKVLKNPYDGEYSQPSQWPEVRQIAAAWSFGEPIRLGNSPKSDSDLRAILEAIAAENPVPELVRAGSLASGSDYFAKPERRHPGAFTAAVIRRLLAAPKPSAPADPDFAAAAAERQIRETYGDQP